MDATSRRRLLVAFVALVAVIAGGSVGFRQLSDDDWLTAVYHALIAISLTGVSADPGSHALVVLDIALIAAGVAIFAYVAGAVVEMVARGVVSGAVGERRRRRPIERMRDHHIICGYGRVGRRIARELREAGTEFVVLDFNEQALGNARADGVVWIDGSGAEDDDLERAGLDHARGLLAVGTAEELRRLEELFAPREAVAR